MKPLDIVKDSISIRHYVNMDEITKTHFRKAECERISSRNFSRE